LNFEKKKKNGKRNWKENWKEKEKLELREIGIKRNWKDFFPLNYAILSLLENA